MAVIYRKRITAGLMDIDDVPSLFREKTRQEVIRYYVDEIKKGKLTIDDVLDAWKDEVQAELETE